MIKIALFEERVYRPDRAAAGGQACRDRFQDRFIRRYDEEHDPRGHPDEPVLHCGAGDLREDSGPSFALYLRNNRCEISLQV